MKRTQLTWLTILVLGVFTLMGAVSCQLGPMPGGEDVYVDGPGDMGFEGLEELNNPLTQVVCTYDADTDKVSMTLDDEVAVISRDKDLYIRVNGYTCGNGDNTTEPLAKTNNTTKIEITGTDSSDEMVVIDYMGGLFALGNASDVGIELFTMEATDKFRIRGTTGNDRITFGNLGVSVNGDSYLDIDFEDAGDIVVSTGAGNDVISAQGNAYGTGTSAFSDHPLTLYGGEGNDTITGGDEATTGDTIYGGDGVDTLAGGAGDDTFYGGAGNDTFNAEADKLGDDVYNGGDDTDTITYANRTVAVTVTIGAGANDGDQTATAEADDVKNDVEVVTGTDYADTLTCVNSYACTLNGGAGNDTLTGADQADTINGGTGNDSILGKDGADTLRGDAGDDTFDEESDTNGGDTMYGGTGTDTVDYDARTENLYVTMGDNLANDGEDDGEDGSAADELDNVRSDIENIACGSGDDTITGNNLDNQITGDDGNDTLNGGSGNDTFLEGSDTNGADTFNGGAGTDLLDYSSRSDPLYVTMGDDTANDGEDDGGDGAAADELDDVKDDVENIAGGSGADTITGNGSANEIFGDAGNDTLAGGAGDDLIDGGAGTDTADCGAGDGDIAFNATPTNCEIY